MNSKQRFFYTLKFLKPCNHSLKLIDKKIKKKREMLTCVFKTQVQKLKI